LWLSPCLATWLRALLAASSCSSQAAAMEIPREIQTYPDPQPSQLETRQHFQVSECLFCGRRAHGSSPASNWSAPVRPGSSKVSVLVRCRIVSKVYCSTPFQSLVCWARLILRQAEVVCQWHVVIGPNQSDLK
jgi:hypothetical protein